jgi:peptide/nickel transport system permease protein
MRTVISHIREWRARNKSRIKEFRLSVDYFMRSPLAVAGLIVILGVIVVAVAAPIIAPYPAVYVDLENRMLPPSLNHLFGTDDIGRDIFSRVLYGSGITLQVGVIVILVAYSIAIPLGTVAGYKGGLTSDIIMRFTDMFLAFPSIILALAFSAALGPGITNAMLALALTWWPWATRITRSQALSIKESYYVEAAKALGASDSYIIFHHVIPNCMGPIVVQATVDFGWTVLVAASLGFLGLGAQPPAPDWGLMVSIGRTYFISQPWLSLFPGLAIFVTVLAANLLGDGLRDVLDPRLRRR